MRDMARQAAPAGFHAVLARLDRAELAACRRFNSAVYRIHLLRTFRIASRLGDGVVWYTLIAGLALFFGDEGRRAALQCVFAGVTGLLLYRVIKGVLVRERPFITHSSIICAGHPLDRFSFPSGHTLHAVTFTLIACSAAPILALLLVPLSILVAMSRVVLGLHYPSDVLAGGAIGAGLAFATLSWLPV